MKKTFTINLAGYVFYIDEDAYELLDKYLGNLRHHFMREAGGNEIVNDIELRISELFSEYIQTGKQVVSIEQVEEVISRVGNPEQMDEEPETKQEDQAGSSAETPSDSERVKRRFFRDPNDKILGGVLSGLACYMDWNPTALRVLFIVFSFFMFWATFIGYLAVWLLTPEAKTASDFLYMRGENVTVENIGKNVTEGYERMHEYIKSPKTQSNLQRFGEGFVNFFGSLVKFLFVTICVILTPILLVLLLIAVKVIIFSVIVLQNISISAFDVFPYMQDWEHFFGSPTAFLWGGITAIVLAGIPLFALIHSIMRFLGKVKPLSTGIKITLIILWITASIVAGYLFTNSMIQYKNPHRTTEWIHIPH